MIWRLPQYLERKGSGLVKDGFGDLGNQKNLKYLRLVS